MRLFTSLLCVALLLVGLAAYAAVSRPISSAPRVMSFQGKLTDPSGVPQVGTFQMTFRLWDSETGGTMLLEDVHPSVEVDDEGLYNVEMEIAGSVTFEDPVWMGVEVETDGEMTPRYRLTSSPYTFWAMNAGKLEGNTVSDLDLRFVNEGQVNSITSVMIVDGEIVDADVSATADIDPSKIKDTAWTSANDGSGSGLDADYLDGMDSSEFATPASDYGRSGVASDLYEGTTKLEDKYVNEGQADAITTGMIKDGEVTTPDLADLSVTTGKLADDAVTTGKIGAGEVGTSDLADGSVTEPKLATDAVTTGKIKDGEVMTGDLANLSVTTGKIANDAVTTDKIGAGEVGTSDLADGSVTEPKLATDAVTTGKIKDGEVITGDLANLSVTTGKIVNASVTNAKIADLSVSTAKMTDDAVTTGKITDGTILFEDISQNGAGTDQIMKWNGSAWFAADDEAEDADWTISGSDMYSSVSGNVGIGTSSPSEKLDVSGNVRASGTITSGSSITIDGGSDKITASGGTIDFDDENLSTDGKARIGPGCTNAGTNAFVAGKNNVASGKYATVGGGQDNTASGYYSATVGGGQQNTASGWYATVGGGVGNTASDYFATVGGGEENTASDNHATVGGGEKNTASKWNATVGGGESNTASERFTTVGGGAVNIASGWFATASGGIYGTASGYAATVGGGYDNTASGDYSFAVGMHNSAAGYYSFAVGLSDTAAGSGSFAVGVVSHVLSTHGNSAALNGMTTTASGQTRVGTLSKASGTFTIDHPLDPENKILNHYFVESPEMVLIYRGVAHISRDGRAEVHLPDYFDALNRNPMVQLTGVGTSDVYVAEKVQGNHFVIGGKPGTEVYWTVTGDRKDQSAEITRIIMPVEQRREEALAGRSLDDEFLASTKAQLEQMGKAGQFSFRTPAGRERYEETKRLLESTEQVEPQWDMKSGQ